MGNIRVFDLRNGDVVIFFGENYCHDYAKENIEQIKEDIAAYESGSNPEKWDGNEIEHFDLEDFEEDETVDEISVDTLLQKDSIIEKMISIIEENISEHGGFTDENVGDQMEEYFRRMLPENDHDLSDLYEKALEKFLERHEGSYKMTRAFSDRYGNVGADISYGFDRDTFLRYLMERESVYEGEDTYTKDELEAAIEQIKEPSINKEISL